MLILFGGTFDPIHTGHIALANALYNKFKQPITFIPTGPQTYKANPIATPIQRLEMLNLVITNNKHFNIDTSEIFSNERCYTFKTLSIIREKIGYNTPIFFVIGGDSLITLDTWDNWQGLLQLTNFIVCKRYGFSIDKMSKELAYEFKLRKTLSIDIHTAYGLFYVIDFLPIDVSSTQIGTNIKNHIPITGLVPNNIESYIVTKGLYL